MFSKVNRTLVLYFSTCLIISSSLILFSITFYWKKGPISTNYINSIYESSTLYDQLAKDNLSEKFFQSVDGQIQRSNINSIDALENKISQLQKNLKPSQNPLLINKLHEVKGLVNKIISYPEITSILKVLSSKIERFNQLCQEKNWKTLERISGRILAKTKYDFSYHNFSKMQENLRFIIKEIQSMRSITESSLLTDNDKNMIYLRLEAFSTEIQMLKNYIDDSNHLQKKIIPFVNDFNNWLKEIGPIISIEKLKFNKKEQFFIFTLLGIALLNVVLLAMGILLSWKNSGRTKKFIEETILQTLRNGILAKNFHLDSQFSSDFIQEMSKHHQFIQRRMNYGLYFQEGLPFASVLVNEELKITWANSLFLELFKLKSTKDDQLNLNWEFISQLTNLVEENPLLDALKHNISGIYQIFVRTDNNQKPIPFEMYVTPLQSNGQKQVMLFFYPLVSLQETIQGHLENALGPVRKFLQLTLGHKAALLDFSNLEKEFEFSDIQDIYLHLKNNYELQKTSSLQLSEQISKLEIEIQDYRKFFQDLLIKVPELLNFHNILGKEFNQIKESFIIFDQEIEFLRSHSQKTLSCCKKISNEGNKYLTGSENIVNHFISIKQLFEQLSKTRSNLKNYKDTFINTRRILLQGKNNSGSSILDERIQAIEQDLGELEKVVLSIDVQLSKGEMILSGVNLIETYKKQTENYKNIMLNEESAIKTFVEEKSLHEQQNIEQQELSINLLKDLQQQYKSFSTTLSSLNELIRFYQDEEETTIPLAQGNPEQTA